MSEESELEEAAVGAGKKELKDKIAVRFGGWVDDLADVFVANEFTVVDVDVIIVKELDEAALQLVLSIGCFKIAMKNLLCCIASIVLRGRTSRREL